MNKLENKVSIITGAGSGMGKAIALLFAAHGSHVIAADINQSRLDGLIKEIDEAGGKATALIADMTKEEDIENMISHAVSTYGALDILVNNAGIMDNFAAVGNVDNELWGKVMKINVEGPFKAMRSAIKIFLSQGSGTIVNISSLGGLNGGRAGAAYTASKHALIGLSKNTGFMYAKSAIRCNVIAPGAINTAISDTIDFSKMTALANERIMPGMVLNPRVGESTEIANATLFLASDDSSFINGTVLIVDGGWSAY